jgi:lipopolysaccharide assembly protein A
MTIFILILALILAIVAVAFALQNPLIVIATFFTLNMKGSLALFVLIGVGVGFVIGVLAMLPSVLKAALTVSHHRKQISKLEKSLNEQKKTETVVVDGKTKSDEAPKQ